MNDLVTVADADALIALVLEKDPNHEKAVSISTVLKEKGIAIIFPVTVFPEAITSLRRAANQPEKARLINTQLAQGAFHVEYIDEEILFSASQMFTLADSKQNTFFDAIVAATAKRLAASAIFSFDRWYTALGYPLAGNVYL